MDGMPRPFPIIGPLFGYNSAFLSRAITFKLKAADSLLQRPLSHDEMTAIVYWTAKQMSYMSYSPVIGVGGGLWRAYATADRFRFPMYQPNLETFNKDVFPHTKAPWLTGARAVMTWHLTRAFWYAAAGNFLAKGVIGSYAMSVGTVGEMTDPRLTDYISQVRQRNQKRQGGLGIPPAQQESQPGRTAPSPETQQVYDDASPAGGIYTEEDFQQNKPVVPVVPSTPSPPPEEGKSFDFFDDASSTGGQAMSGDTRSPSTPQRTGSAWDRLRSRQTPAQNQNQSQPSSWQQRQSDERRDQHEGAGQHDAQAEFDARIERERKGGDFSSNGGDQKRW
jgi:hypothetical protein